VYRWFLAYKYVFSRLITLGALLAVTLSVAVLIVVVTVLEGFRSELEERIRGSTSDIKVESTMGIGLRDARRVESILRQVPGIERTHLVVETFALYQRSDDELRDRTAQDCFLVVRDLADPVTRQELDAYVRAVERPDLDELPDSFVKLADDIFAGLPRDSASLFSEEWLGTQLWKPFERPRDLRFWRSRPEDLPPPVVVGVENFRRLLLPGDRIRLTSFAPDSFEPIAQEFLVAGYFKTGFYEQDSQAFLLRLEDAEEFLRLKDDDGTLRVSAIRVTADADHRDGEALAALRQRIEAVLRAESVYFVRTQTWREARAPLLQAVKVEKVIVSIVLGAVVLFAGFIIFIILTVQVVEKIRDIGVLQSLGATPAGIATLYFVIGCSICLAGMILGTMYGTSFALSINTIQRWIEILTGWVVFPDDIYYLDHIPVRFRVVDLVFIIATTVLASLVASVVPALRCARKPPTVGLRYE
jgi:lipoprotein-releasing system permease protein